MFESSISIVGMCIALISIIIVVYDHFKDDRILTRQVHKFYHYIEGLIFTYYQLKIEEENSSIMDNPEELRKKFSKISRENVFYQGKITQLFESFSRYLGLTYYRKPSNYLIDDHDYFIEYTGSIMHFFSGSPTKLGNPTHSFYNNPKKRIVIDDKEIRIINGLLMRLRLHWNNNFSKFLFKKKIKLFRNYELLKTPDI